MVERCRGVGPCQALAAEGGGRQDRLYKGQASPATIATGGPTGCGSRSCARAKPLAARYITHSKFNRAGKITADRIRRGVFKSVTELTTTIDDYIAHNNAH